MVKIVGVSSCPAGLAHTPMAAKALEKAGEKLGIDVKIEQQGVMGKVNELTQKEIDEADFVIYASELKIIDEHRFNNKERIRVNIGTVIKAPEAVLKKCISSMEERDKQ